MKKSSNDPPSIDENGRMINPHNPEFITKVPWYLGSSGPTLKHHNVQKKDHILTLQETDQIILNKSNKATSISSKQICCTNCGSSYHATKDCVERPRSKTQIKKVGYQLNNIVNDKSVNLENFGKVSYDAKRDNYRGYDPKLYQEVINNFELIENERKLYKNKLKSESEKQNDNLNENQGDQKADPSDETNVDSIIDSNSDSDSDDDSNMDDDFDDVINKDNNIKDFQYRSQRQGGLGGNSMKTTSRNLRIREDTPKYLRNLALDSAYYDPKSRSMRDNPYKDKMNNQSLNELVYAGDNYLKQSGDTLKLAQSQVLCWEMNGDELLGDAENKIDVLTNPSQAEMLYKKYLTIKESKSNKKKQMLLEKYGQVDGKVDNSEDSKTESKVDNIKLTNELDLRLRFGQSEVYIEYDRITGQPINKSAIQSKISKYPEDVYINNHTSVWGSYYDIKTKSWGYKCCHSLIKMSYCVGSTAIDNNKVDTQIYTRIDNKVSIEDNKVDKPLGISTKQSITKTSDLYGNSSVLSDSLDKNKVNQSVYLNKNNQIDQNQNKRSYNSMVDSNVSIEDMEAYRLSKNHRDDPMSKYVNDEVKF